MTTTTISIEGDAVRVAGLVSLYACRDPARPPALGGVQVEPSGPDHVTLCATDGKQLACTRVPGLCTATGIIPWSVLAPLNVRARCRHTDVVRLDVTDGVATLRIFGRETTTVSEPVIPTDFPDWRIYLPRGAIRPARCTWNATMLAATAKLVASVATDLNSVPFIQLQEEVDRCAWVLCAPFGIDLVIGTMPIIGGDASAESHSNRIRGLADAIRKADRDVAVSA